MNFTFMSGPEIIPQREANIQTMEFKTPDPSSESGK